MPALLPLPLFLRQLILHFFEDVGRWARYGLVATIWLVCLPWCIRQTWRGLFWMADGSWLSEPFDSNSTRPPSSDTNLSLHNMSLRYADSTNSTITELNLTNVTVAEISSYVGSMVNRSVTARSILSQSQPAQAWINMLLRFLTGQSLAAKIIRILFSIPPFLDFNSTSRSSHLQVDSNGVFRRPPSLLSEVNLVNSLAPSPFLNHITLDVLEGILICLGLVAGFILIFLIREWVINQQPMLNLPDADAAENPPPPPAPPVNDGRPIVRPRRRRIVPRGAQPADPNAHQHPNRQWHDTPLRNEADSNASAASMAGSDGSVDSATTSAPPLLRGAIGEAVNVHRALEEAPIPPDGRELHPARLISSRPILPGEERLLVINSIPAGPLPRPSSPLVHFDTNVEVIDTLARPDTPTVEPAQAFEFHFEPEPEAASWPQPDLQPSGSNSPALSTPGTSDEDEAGIDVGFSTGAVADPSDITHDGPEATIAPAVAEDAVADEGSEVEGEITEPLNTPPSMADKLFDWLWHVDTPVPAMDPHGVHIETHVVGDAQAAAPFVPIHNRILAEDDIPAFEAPAANLEQALDAPDMPQNIDWNDPNAVDEIEDLEGVLELVGMEGPMVAMMQNVLFSLFLITITLTGSIWIPYIWGKIMLILLAHPVIVLFKAPVFLISNIADLVAELAFFMMGLIGLAVNAAIRTAKAVTAMLSPRLSGLLDITRFEELALDITHQSGTRLEQTVTATLQTLSPDVPAFSIQSHRALVLFKTTVKGAFSALLTKAINYYDCMSLDVFSIKLARRLLRSSAASLIALPGTLQTLTSSMISHIRSGFSVQLKPLTVDPSSEIEFVEWSPQDKIIAIVMGYIFFFLLGYVFLQVAHLVLGLKKDEKVEGPFADGFRQASGVLKVIIIIGIEMILFPLYCGLLLDIALLPLFQGATIHTRLAFIARAPFTGLFLHWFVGTCYMFHFALFVSICRKILRKGVLYFIRDPDDPTFHPVRDVLERPVPTQLGKIAFSALVYGGLVIMCLGAVVWGIGWMDGVLPIQWSTPAPRMEFPMDVIFYNFLLPSIVRKLEPSKKISAIYEWWFRGCAHGLRLTHFLFGEEREDEKLTRGLFFHHESGQKDGSYVRAPASDSCRIPKGKNVFVPVSENNERLDGESETEQGLHGSKDEKWTKLYLPPQFKARVATFVVLLWIFAATTGVGFTIGPLLFGRAVLRYLSGSSGPVNDLYAFTIGTHLFAAIVYSAVHSRRLVETIKTSAFSARLTQGWPLLKQILSVAYLFIAFTLIFPVVLSLIAELYIHIPVFTVLSNATSSSTTHTTRSLHTIMTVKSSPPVFFLQSYTLGLLYMRLAFRFATNYPCPHTRLATAIRTVFRNGILNPDIRLANRAMILPLTVLCVLLLGTPLIYGKLTILAMGISSHANIDTEMRQRVYRMAYPEILGLAIIGRGVVDGKKRLDAWRGRIRDEVYLVGEKLHNYRDSSKPIANPKIQSEIQPEDTGGDQLGEKGKGKETNPLTDPDPDLEIRQGKESERTSTDETQKHELEKEIGLQIDDNDLKQVWDQYDRMIGRDPTSPSRTVGGTSSRTGVEEDNV